MVLKVNSTNQVAAGTGLFEEGEHFGCLYMILKGKAEIYNRGFCVQVGAGTLLGIEQLEGEVSSCGCRAVDDLAVYAVEASSPKSLSALFTANKDYCGISVFSHSRILSELVKQYKALCECADNIYNDLKAGYDRYIGISRSGGLRAVPMPEVVQLEAYVNDIDEDGNTVRMISEYQRVPYDAVKAFFGTSIPLSIETLTTVESMESMYMDACASISDFIAGTFMLLVGDEEYSLCRNMLGLGLDMKIMGYPVTDIEKPVSKYLDYLSGVRALIGEGTGRVWLTDDGAVRDMYDAFAAGRDFRITETAEEETGSEVTVSLDDLKNSYHQITSFGGYPEDKAAEFGKLIDTFAAADDRGSSDDDIRRLRKDIATCYFDLYTHVFLESMNAVRIPKAVELFLDFGYVSEKLLRPDQLTELLKVGPNVQCDSCVVYTMREWLTAVYKGVKEPSRNDMGLDYADTLREMKKSGTISADDEKRLLTDGTEKLKYEIASVMKQAIRVVNGQLSTFVPILYSDMFIGEIVKVYNSAEKVNEVFDKLLSVDFSIFHREALYTDPEHGIEREYEMKQVNPIFILYPTVGQNVIMWQEITGRKRDSEGRFFAPAFSYSALTDMMIKAFGQFRWALCKTIQGTNWNNIQIRSLTSEYSDYIQFYKKNHNLSDERKEKLKLQIQRGRNNLREIFTLDYEVWIKSEANGAIKLNKVIRDIMAVYCPFAADVKKNLIRQPIYEEGFARSNRERGKKVHDLELRFKALEAKGVKLPQQLTDTLKFYRDM